MGFFEEHSRGNESLSGSLAETQAAVLEPQDSWEVQLIAGWNQKCNLDVCCTKLAKEAFIWGGSIASRMVLVVFSISVQGKSCTPHASSMKMWRQLCSKRERRRHGVRMVKITRGIENLHICNKKSNVLFVFRNWRSSIEQRIRIWRDWVAVSRLEAIFCFGVVVVKWLRCDEDHMSEVHRLVTDMGRAFPRNCRRL